MAVVLSLKASLVLCMVLAVGASSKASPPAFYRVNRLDLYRKCPSPQCGGLYLEKLNSVPQAENYVGSVDLSLLDKSTEKTVTDFIAKFGTGLVVYRGRIAPLLINNKDTGVNKLVVITAYLGLPGANVTTDVKGLAFYTATGAGPTVWVRPVNVNSSLLQLNTKTSKLYAQPSWNLDLTWQRHEILRAGAIVTAPRVAWGSKPPAKNLTFVAREVFIRLPIAVGPPGSMGRCPLNELWCNPSEGLFKVYTRQPNLCFVPGCRNVTGACTLLIPTCGDGYRLACWPAPPFACGGFACDPEFAPVATKSC